MLCEQDALCTCRSGLVAALQRSQGSVQTPAASQTCLPTPGGFPAPPSLPHSYIDLLDCTGTLLSMARLLDFSMPGACALCGVGKVSGTVELTARISAQHHMLTVGSALRTPAFIPTCNPAPSALLSRPPPSPCPILCAILGTLSLPQAS